MRRLLVTACLCAALAIATTSGAISWSDWERENAIAQKGDFLVIRQPGEGFCYLKQSYNDELDKLGLSMKSDKKPFLPLPFFRGLDGDVTYRVDDGPVAIIPESEASNPLRLPSSIVPELKRGRFLIIRVKPKGRSTLEQRFSLRGFSAATALLRSPQCSK